MAPDSATFGLTKEQLKDLAELRGLNYEQTNLPPYDGAKGVLRKLRVPSENYGLDALNTNDLEERRSVFGKNVWSRIQRDRQATVLRNGKSQQIPIVEVVVGDLCLLKVGDVLPADGLVIESNNLQIDESPLTGEAELVNKPSGDIVLADTQVKSGMGKMVVIAVGIYSAGGSIDQLFPPLAE